VPAEPDPSLRLLWRHVTPTAEPAAPARRGPKQKLSVDAVVDAAIELADRDGLGALAMRGLAQQLGLGVMSLYTYVPSRNDLIALMVDQVLGRTELAPMPDELAARLELIVRTQYADVLAHPWLTEVSGVRAWLGPHSADRYEWQLSAVEGIGLDDIEMDQTVSLLVGFATATARAAHDVQRAERESGTSELEWWEANAETLGEVMAGRDYPLAGRVGSAAGEAYQGASDPARQLEFGLGRIIDGVLAYVERSGA
jgi:AcrR family transcriptional regulator